MISIITPIYNTPNNSLYDYFDALTKIDKALFEVVLVNDGGNLDIDLSNWNLDIKYVEYAENRGPGYARQQGIEHASHDYVMFCDSDDYIEKIGFMSCISTIRILNPDIIYPSVMNWVKGNFSEQIPNNFPDNIHGLCIKKNFLMQNNIAFLNEYYHEDGFFTVDCADVAEKVDAVIQSIDQPIVAHRVRKDSLSYFNHQEIYDLSLAVSVISIYNRLPQRYFVYDDKDNIWVKTITGRLSAAREQNYMENENVVFLFNFLYSCLWPTLPQSLRANIANNNPKTFVNFNIDLIAINDIASKIYELYHEENQMIQEYLLKQMLIAYNIYKTATSKADWFLPLTITIPTYNNSDEQIQRALNSIYEQIFGHSFNIIIVDDGSNNPITPERLTNLGVMNENIQIIRFDINKGVGAARQKALEAVRTPLIMFMDMDDYLVNPYFTLQALSILTDRKGVFGIQGREYVGFYDIWTSNTDYYQGGTLHGFICKVAPLKKYNIHFPLFQYGEDGVFINEMNFYNLPVIVLNEPQYNRCTGYLTNEIYSFLSNLNSITDIITNIRFISKLPEYDLFTPEEREQKVIMYLSRMIFEALQSMHLRDIHESDKDYSEQILRQPYIEPKDRYMLCLYLTIELFRTLPIEYLYNLRHDFGINQCDNVVPIIDNLIMGIDVYWLASYNCFISFEDLREKCKEYIKYNLETEGAQPGNTIIPQALKHLPWCYEPANWK